MSQPAKGVTGTRQNSYVSNPELVTAQDLDQWSDTLAAQTTLPILVRRLILATASVTEISMRAREGALVPGWDGIARCDTADPHVPLGNSGWELGTSKEPRDKAQSDIRSRTKDPLGLDPKTTTFVAVTSRIADGLPWLARQLQRWPDGESIPQQIGLLLAVTRPNEDLVTIVGALHPDVQEGFWQSVNAILVHPNARPLVARKLIEHRRPWGAIDLLVTMLHAAGGSVSPDVDLVESALMGAATGPSDDSPRASSLSWEVSELLDYLERSGSDIETRARLEFLYAHLLQHTRAAGALNEVLGTDPALFAEIMSYIYPSKGKPHDETVPPERRAIALVGYTVIKSWHTPPGVRRDGTADAAALRHWVTEARRLLAESGRATVGDRVIGEVLAYFPPDADGLWPAEPVRDLIEDLGAPKFEQGLDIGKFNSRGITTRNPADGGAQERALAAQHREWAGRVADRWPRTGALLRQIADSYDEWARREDDQSEHFGDDGS